MARISVAPLFVGNSSCLEEKLASRENNFNLVRLVLALVVCLDHAGLVWSGQTHSEMLRIGSVSGGFLAVNGFFVLSGMLIARSLERGGVGVNYFASRFLRLYPALLALALISVLIIGPLVSKQYYWVGASVFDYAFEVLRFGNTMGSPVGFYPENPYPLEFDSPLWTLRYEVLCYIAAPIILFVSITHRATVAFVGTCVLGGLACYFEPHVNSIFGNDAVAACLRFAFCFGVGINIWLWRRFVTGHFFWVVLLGVAFALSIFWDVGVDVAATLFVASFVIWAGLLPAEKLRKVGDVDLSYGVYIWHFPILQILRGEFVWGSPTALLLAALILVLPVAWLSWVCVEHPALRAKGMITRRRIVR